MITKQDLTFTPPLSRISSQLSQAGYAVICGSNNTGKSLVLKHLKKVMGLTAYMVGPQRFYHIYHIGTQLRQPNEFQEFENNFNNQFNDETHNHEQNFIDLNRIITGLSNAKRASLFEVCGRLIGSKFSLKLVEPENELSMRYVDMDGQNISVGSTGTRLLMTLIGLCMDERIGTILIDEPELGLGPKVQETLAKFFANREEREKYFPTLNGIVVATHSHLFLDRTEIQNNFVVSKNKHEISIEQISSFNQFHNLQFNLLGNTFESLFLPSAFVLVEGKTDEPFIERCVKYRFPDRKVVVVECQGDLKRQLHLLSKALGDIQRSPFRSRIFAVLDSIHTPSDRTVISQMGVPSENIVIWDKNGIEYLYPPSLMASRFNCSEERLNDIQIEGDNVSLNGISLRKIQLSEAILKEISPTTKLAAEFEAKLLGPLQRALD